MEWHEQKGATIMGRHKWQHWNNYSIAMQNQGLAHAMYGLGEPAEHLDILQDYAKSIHYEIVDSEVR